jgi:hypothetical protein
MRVGRTVDLKAASTVAQTELLMAGHLVLG